MREIKFRAWVNEEDEEYSRMVYSEQPIVTILGHKYGKKGVARPSGFSNIDNQPKPERYVLMQYTGLKDENGREIYEGDIVRHAADEGVYKVIFEDGGFYVKNLFEYDFQTINEYPLEVIGNIYEKPKLLGG